MVAGPELSRILEEYEMILNSSNENVKHHEQVSSVQTAFHKDVTNLVDVITDIGNPFAEDSGDLLTLDTKVIMDPEVAETVKTAFQLGEEQYKNFVKERFIDRKVPIQEPIKKNNLSLFSTKKSTNKQDKTPRKMTVNYFLDCILPVRAEKEIWKNSLNMRTNHILHPCQTGNKANRNKS